MLTGGDIYGERPTLGSVSNSTGRRKAALPKRLVNKKASEGVRIPKSARRTKRRV